MVPDGSEGLSCAGRSWGRGGRGRMEELARRKGHDSSKVVGEERIGDDADCSDRGRRADERRGSECKKRSAVVEQVLLAN